MEDERDDDRVGNANPAAVFFWGVDEEIEVFLHPIVVYAAPGRFVEGETFEISSRFRALHEC